MKRITIAIAAIAALALLVAAAPAGAKPKAKPTAREYFGTSESGSDMSFIRAGKVMWHIDGYIPVTCVPDHGTPTTSSTAFDPPGSFVVGKSRKASDTETLPYKGDVTKNYEITFEKGKGKEWIGHLHLNYSYTEVFFGYGSEIDQTVVICQGDDEMIFWV